MLTNPAPLAALQLIRVICRGGATPATALPHIERLCDAALGQIASEGRELVNWREACRLAAELRLDQRQELAVDR